MEFSNLLYIAFMTPFLYGFEIQMDALQISLEVISLMISLIVIIVKLRTYVINNGEKTLDLVVILKNYRNEGLFVDIFGIIPLNLILGIALNIR